MSSFEERIKNLEVNGGKNVSLCDSELDLARRIFIKIVSLPCFGAGTIPGDPSSNPLTEAELETFKRLMLKYKGEKYDDF